MVHEIDAVLGDDERLQWYLMAVDTGVWLEASLPTASSLALLYRFIPPSDTNQPPLQGERALEMQKQKSDDSVDESVDSIEEEIRITKKLIQDMGDVNITVEIHGTSKEELNGQKGRVVEYVHVSSPCPVPDPILA